MHYKKYKNIQFLLFVFVYVFFSFFSCSKKNLTSEFDREKLFTLNYGKFEDELDLFNLETNYSSPDSQIFMKDGMFYISNSASKKVMLLTSFGDLLSVYYDSDTNPHPSFALSNQNPIDNSEITKTTQKAIEYPLQFPTHLTIDNKKNLYIVDNVPAERFQYDTDEGILLKEVILCFAADGTFIDYLGQGGYGGYPFPPINGVFNNTKNELIVVSKTQAGFLIFWFNQEGNLLYKVPIHFNAIPNPYNASVRFYANLENIFPDYNYNRLYLKIDYYTALIDTDTGADIGIAFDKSIVYPLNLNTSLYEEAIDIPFFTDTDSNGFDKKRYKKPYEMLGITNSGWIFLVNPIQTGYVLEIFDTKSKKIMNRTLKVSNDEAVYNAMNLSPDGILSALLAGSYEASIVWWRTDSLIGELRR